MTMFLSLIAFVGVIVLAVRGLGYRMAYLGAAVLALVLGVFAIALWPSEAQLALASGEDYAQRRGLQIMHDYFADVATWCFAVAFGALLATIVYRRKDAR